MSDTGFRIHEGSVTVRGLGWVALAIFFGIALSGGAALIRVSDTTIAYLGFRGMLICDVKLMACRKLDLGPLP